MNNEITINITGAGNTAKSSISKLISELLNSWDIETSLNQVGGDRLPVSTERAEEVVLMLSERGLKITINEVTTFENLNKETK